MTVSDFCVRHVQIDVPRLLTRLLNHDNFRRRLEQEERTSREQVIGHPLRLAGLARSIGDFSGEDLVIVLLHDVLRPLLQIGVRKVANAVRARP